MSLLSSYGMRLRTVRTSSGRRLPFLRPLTLAAAAAVLAACGGDDPVAVSSVTVTPATSSIVLGSTSQLAAATLDANGAVMTGRAVTWTTSNASIATVAGGLVTGVAPGNATITATSEGKTGSAAVTILPPPVATVAITPATPSVTETDTLRLTATLKAADGSTLTGRVITWTSATPAIATVNSSGLVTGIQPGTSVITATSEGRSATATLTVTISPCNISLSTPIVPGTPVNGTLAATDCNFGDDTFLDVYRVTIASATTMQTIMRSTAFDAYLFIYSLVGQTLTKIGEDDDSGGGPMATDAMLSGGIAAGTHFILANSINTFGFGAYTLTFTSPFSSIASSSLLSPGVSVEKLGPAEARVIHGLIRRSNRRR